MPASASGVTTRTCGQCRHEVGGRMIRCLYCGAPMETAVEREARSCPRCGKPLAQFPSTWVAIDLCGACGGQFYDRGELDRAAKLEDRGVKWLSENLLLRPPDSPSGKPLACPGCTAEMRSFVLLTAKDLHLDICSRCKGTWLDRDEPHKLRLAISDGLSPVTAVLPPIGRVRSGARLRSVDESAFSTAAGVATELAIEFGVEIVIDSLVDILIES